MIWLCIWPALAGCCRCPTGTLELRLDRSQAARLERVSADLGTLEPGTLSVRVAGLGAQASREGSRLTFEVPQDAPAGVQVVEVRSGGTLAEGRLRVLGDDVIAGQATLLLARDIAESELQVRLARLNPNFRLERLRGLDPLGAGLEAANPCAGSLAEIDVGGVPLGQALEDLRRLEQQDPGLVLFIDPQSGPNVGGAPVDPLGASHALAAHARGLTGAGTLIAVLDTGVSPHPELAGRLRPGYNALTGTADSLDDYALDSPGHGTPAAVLAAGRALGVAPGAALLPVKVCGASGVCLSSDVIVGTCYALAASTLQDEALVLNYSLSGETEIQALTAILDYALEQRVLVAAAGGNQRAAIPPGSRRYPAASELPGLVAVAALSPAPAACLSFEGLEEGATYGVGEGFEEAGVAVGFAPFTLSSGEVLGSGSAYPEAGIFAQGQALWTSTIVATFDFGAPVGGVTLEFADFGGEVNVLLNDSSLSASDLSELPEALGGLRLSVTPPTRLAPAQLRVLGELRRFGVGGQEFALGEVCPVTGAQGAWLSAPFGVRGDYLDVAAPGDGVISGTPAGGLASYAGTSFATPQVAGALALWREAEPSLSPADIESRLKSAAGALPFPASAVGVGRLDLSVTP